jgi:hypothetical protein
MRNKQKFPVDNCKTLYLRSFCVIRGYGFNPNKCLVTISSENEPQLLPELGHAVWPRRKLQNRQGVTNSVLGVRC